MFLTFKLTSSLSYMKKKLIAIKKLIMSPGKHLVLFSKVLPLFMKCNILNCGGRYSPPRDFISRDVSEGN